MTTESQGRSEVAPGRLERSDAVALVLLALAALPIYLTAPRSGDFWWSEAPRNALNGAFVLDFLRALPLTDPVDWAFDYYSHRPALTILFYPPLFHLVLGGVYAVFGVDHAPATALVVLFFIVAAGGIYALLRRLVDPACALAGALLFLGSPEILRWGQQVMLELPMLAFAIWSTFFLLRYGDRDRPRDLFLSALLMVAALYTKQPAGFIAVGLALALLFYKGPSLLRRRNLWTVTLLSALAVVPLVYLQLSFGRLNFEQVTAQEAVKASLEGFEASALARWTWYLLRLPAMAWGTAFLASAWVVLALLRREWRPPRWDGLVLVGWFGSCYLFLTWIAIKSPRFGVPLLPPLCVMAALFLAGVLAGRRLSWLAPVVAALMFAVTLAFYPTPRVEGYREAASEIYRLASPDERVLFAGNRDGDFIFNLRALGTETPAVIRADRLFLAIRVTPEHGLNPRDLGREEILGLLEGYAVSYVVTVPEIWSEAPVMASFHQLLKTDQFVEVGRIAVRHWPSRPRDGETELVIYRNRAPLSDPPRALRFEPSLLQ